MDEYLKALLAALLAAAGTVLGFRPGLKRAQKDIEDLKKNKIDGKVFAEVTKHIDTKFNHQEEWLKGIANKLDTLVERRTKPR
jgi:hypothetical protein